MKQISILLKAAIGLAVCFSQPELYGATGQSDTDQNARIEIFKRAYDRMKPVTISGKVVDTEGSPVAEAEICVSWERPIYVTRGKEDVTRKWVKSDANGFWEISVGKVDTAYILAAKKTGYQYVPGPEAGKDYSEEETEKETPVLIRLRKKGETTFLIKREKIPGIRAISPNAQTNDVDLFKDKRSEPILYVDFRIVADYIPVSNSWAMTYSATNGSDGIIFSDDRLYMAPSDGYLQKIVLSGPPWPKYMYLRSRTPAIYARLEMDYVESKPSRSNNTTCVYHKAWINPYGERNLEYDDSIEASWRVADELRAEAKAALQTKKLPQKPDIPQRIKLMNEKLEREKAEKVKNEK